jgi:NADPH:quinone reductase-like Zn-dependent oxidoreductase
MRLRPATPVCEALLLLDAMKAAVHTRYGPPEVLRVTEAPKPVPKDDEVLVRVRASSVNRTDCGFLRAKPFIVRLFAGLAKPRRTILGCEFAGEVEAVGRNVTRFSVGDRVFGFDDGGWGGHAEYKVISENRMLATIPPAITYEQAAVSTEGAHYALTYVRALHAGKGTTVLVHGATGAIGSAAVQLLKHAGAFVIATSDTKNVELVQSLGADVVVDREKEDFTKLDERVDIVFDAVGKSSFGACKPILEDGGVYVSTDLGPMAQNPLLALVGPLFRLVGAKRVAFPLPKAGSEVIEFLRARLERGELRPVIDRTYALDDIVEAFGYVETGQKTGNVVVLVE